MKIMGVSIGMIAVVIAAYLIGSKYPFKMVKM